ncbi:MAG: HlyD family efflux transporter periplasmic adaptor subunit [Phycisphaerales bacterium JB037]
MRAPIDGVIVEGDFKDRIGSTISLGEPMFVVAQLENMVATIKVPDSDIAYIEEGMAGSLATKSRPGDRYALTVDRIVPLARPEEGGNAFEVRATLADPAAWMRPGMEGLVKLETGDRSIAWILSRRIRDTLRMWLWW